MESLDTAGARKAAHLFATDILAKFGATSVYGTHIYYVCETRPAPDRHTEICGIDPDGGNQRQLTHHSALSSGPAVSADGARIAFATLRGVWGLSVFSLEPFRELRFQNPRDTATVVTPFFTPDGGKILFARGTEEGFQIAMADADGANPRFITKSRSVNVEPKVNPKTGAEIAFVSDRSGRHQIHMMSMDGESVERLTDGNGKAGNPSWNPNGQSLAFAWTLGFAPDAFNIFVMDVASRALTQLTHGEGKNENPSWAPDGKHIVFMSNRTGTSQIWSMLADGTHLRQLTTKGLNSAPVWGR